MFFALPLYVWRTLSKTDDPQTWIFEKILPEEYLHYWWADVVAGSHDRLILAIVFIGYLAIIFAWLAEPAAEALRRYKAPYATYWSKRKLLSKLQETAPKLRAFVLLRRQGTPSAKDNLSFYFGGEADGENPGGTFNLLINRGANPHVVRAALNSQDEKMRYHQETIHLYSEQFAPVVAACLTEAHARGYLKNQQEVSAINNVTSPKSVYAFELDHYLAQVDLMETIVQRMTK